MLCIVLFTALSGVCLSAPIDEKQAWEDYKLEFGKIYINKEEDVRRFEIWKKTSEEVTLSNSFYSKEYEESVNEFSDMTDEEFEKTYLAGLQVPEGDWNVTEDDIRSQAAYGFGAPRAVNWVSSGYVTNVKNQGRCGSCYSFAATGALEAAWYKKTGKLIPMSEQQIVDCSVWSHGCHGGWYTYAWNLIKRSGGIQGESSYPYEARQYRCRFNKRYVVATCTGYKNIYGEAALQQALANVGPVAVAIDASPYGFRRYRRGVFYDPSCSSTKLTHAVLAVGYGSEGGRDYWLVKNSWGTRWGEGGYVKMARNRGNHCGIASRPSYPLV